MTEAQIIRNCAPTLAGLKTGSIFSCGYSSVQELTSMIRNFNIRMKAKGLRVLPLKISKEKALIYLYRPSRLARDFSDNAVRSLLSEFGYQPEHCQKCILHLINKLRTHEDFPHEIGLFLGYPPEDVQGFIKNTACGCKCSGCWKVYGDEEAAKKKFAQYKKCTRVYCQKWANGTTIDRLTVYS